MKKGCIYKISCLLSDKVYIGKTRNYKKRISSHKSTFKRDKHSFAIYYAMNKYGWENFNFEIIAYGIYNDYLLNELEKHFIRLFASQSPNGYNMDGGGSGIHSHSEQTKKKISEHGKNSNKGALLLRINPYFGKSGKDAAAYNKKVYNFIHPIHGVERCTQYELRTKYNLPPSSISIICTGKKKSSYGWMIEGVKYAKRDYAIHCFTHPVHGVELCTYYDLYKKYNLDKKGLFALCKGKLKNPYKGWSINR